MRWLLTSVGVHVLVLGFAPSPFAASARPAAAEAADAPHRPPPPGVARGADPTTGPIDAGRDRREAGARPRPGPERRLEVVRISAGPAHRRDDAVAEPPAAPRPSGDAEVAAAPTPVDPPAPEPEPPRPPPPRPVDGFLRFVAVARSVVKDLPETATIAAFDAAAEVAARPEVTDPNEGPRLDGVRSRVSGTPSPVVSPVRGPAEQGAGEPEPSPTPGDAEQVETAGTAPDHTTRPERAAPPPPSAQPEPVTPPPPAVAGARAAPSGFGALPSRDGGDPGPVHTVIDRADRGTTRIAGAPQPVSPSPPPSAPARTGRAPAPTPPVEAPRTPAVATGPDRPPAPPAPPVPPTPIAAREPVDAEVDGRPRPDARADAEVTTRTAASTHTGAGPRTAGHPDPARPTEPFAPAFSPVAAFDDPSDTDAVRIDARATALGRWYAGVQEEIRDRWMSIRLPIDDLAFGLGGEVVLEIAIARGGRVDAVRVLVESGYAQLDAYAQLAVPERVAPPPDGPQLVRIHFVYRNGVVSTR